MFSRFLFRDPVPDMSVAFERADAGARYLELMCGEDWHQKIDLQALDLGSLFCGLYEQLWGQASGFLPLMNMKDSVALGFSCGWWDVLFFAQPPWVSRSFHRLTEAWKLVIEKRIAQDAVPQPKLPPRASKPNDRGDSGNGRFSCLA